MDVHSFRQSGVGQARKESWPSRLVRLGKRYFAMAHRDDLADSCALAALASDAARSSPGFKKVYEATSDEEVLTSAEVPDHTGN